MTPSGTRVLDHLKAWFDLIRADHPNPSMLDLWHPGMETQINVCTRGYEAVDRDDPKLKSVYTDGRYEFSHFHIPRDAAGKTEKGPHYPNYTMRYPFAEFVDLVGASGWNWKDKCSEWVGFDFDSITGHASGVGVSGAQLKKVREAALSIPWVQANKSKSGEGLHLRALIDNFPTANHDRHAALARCILCIMSEVAGFDFAKAVDVYGSTLWMWSRDAVAKKDAFQHVKTATAKLTHAEIPPNWKDHAEVVRKNRRHVRISGISDDDQIAFDDEVSKEARTPLDDTHRAIISAVEELGEYTTYWESDNHCWVTHSHALKTLMETQRQSLCLKGYFLTLSDGRDPATPNIFCSPIEKGGFKVNRFGRGTSEAKTWRSSVNNWTYTYFNVEPDLAAACEAYGGVPYASGGYDFEKLENAADALTLCGIDVDLPTPLRNGRGGFIVRHKGNSLQSVLCTKKEASDKEHGVGHPWVSPRKSGEWQLTVNVQLNRGGSAGAARLEVDELVRNKVTPAKKDGRYYTFDADSKLWIPRDRGTAKTYLLSHAGTPADAERLLSVATNNVWKMVHLPFHSEYPGDRQWNYDAPQLKFDPLPEGSDLQHPTWDLVLNHIGSDLDAEIKKLEWAQNAGIRNGGDYLKAWLKCVVEHPFSKVPYLFLWSKAEKTGKSNLAMSFGRLITNGVKKADRALNNKQGFNAELEGCVIAYIEEKDLKNDRDTLNRLKDFVTSPKVSIRKMYTDAFEIDSTLHWIQSSNFEDGCVVSETDTRITVIHVSPFKGRQIPQEELDKRLDAEAPSFLREIADMKLPALEDRLRLPVVETSEKRRLQDLNRDPLDVFLDEQAYRIDGHALNVKEFHARFVGTLDSKSSKAYTPERVRKELRKRGYAVAPYSGNKLFIANVAFEPVEPDGLVELYEDKHGVRRQLLFRFSDN